MIDWSLPVVLQTISALAVAGGLAYAALQFREWRSAQYVANFTKLIELQLQLRKMVVDDPTLAPIGLAVPCEARSEELRVGRQAPRVPWHVAKRRSNDPA